MRGLLAHDSVVGVSTDLADLRVAVASDQHAARGARPGMAIIHDTTMSPSKLELLTSWLPAQPWYVDTGREPELAQLAAAAARRWGSARRSSSLRLAAGGGETLRVARPSSGPRA